MIGFLPFLSKVFLLQIFFKRSFLKIQSDTRVWLGAAYQHIPGSGPPPSVLMFVDATYAEGGEP
jgi:hypothetical protein